MGSFHLTPDFILAFRRGQVSYQELVDVVLGHLPEVCPHCRAGSAVLEASVDSSDAKLTLAVLASVLNRHEWPAQKAEADALRDLEEIRDLDKACRLKKILAARRRFRGGLLVRKLISEQRRYLHSSPAEAHHWAELAYHVALESPGFSMDLQALAYAQMANALRAAGKLILASRHFQQVRYMVQHCQVGDLEILAEIFQLEGSLRKDQRKFAQARKLLERSILLSRLIEDRTGAISSLLLLAEIAHSENTLDKAISDVRRLLEIIDARDDPFLYYLSRHNLACYLTAAGFFAEAATLRLEDEPLCRAYFGSVDRIRLAWIDGRIAQGQENHDLALELLETAHRGFQEQGIAVGAAMVARDLLPLYEQKGRFKDRRILALESASVLAAEELDVSSLAPHAVHPPG
jgi:tetratricopeptide (TPR) repeat protein